MINLKNTRKIKEILLIFFTFGLKGNYNIIRNLTLKYKFFYPLYKLYEAQHGAWLPLKADISNDIKFEHGPIGCFISAQAKIGERCILLQHVTIGSNSITKMGGCTNYW